MPEEKDPVEFGFTDHFEDDQESYMIKVKHYLALTDEDRVSYNVADGQFLVHLFSAKGVKSFVVFLNDDLAWATAQEDFIDREFVEIIGSIIDERYFLGK